MNRIKKIALLFVALLAAQHLFAQKKIVVAQDGSGDLKTIQEAITSLPPGVKRQRVIRVKPGIYRENIFIDKNFIMLKGEDPNNTNVSISQARDEWCCNNPDDYGTAAINLKGSDICLQNLSFINSYGKDAKTEKILTCANESGKEKTVRLNIHQMSLRTFAEEMASQKRRWPKWNMKEEQAMHGMATGR